MSIFIYFFHHSQTYDLWIECHSNMEILCLTQVLTMLNDRQNRKLAVLFAFPSSTIFIDSSLGVVLPYIGDIIAYRHGLHFCQGAFSKNRHYICFTVYYRYCIGTTVSHIYHVAVGINSHPLRIDTHLNAT